MKEKKKFFALVGPIRSGKSTVMEALKSRLDDGNTLFLSDSCGMLDSTHTPFTSAISEAARSGCHEHTTPLSQLIFFWARLQPIIELDISPALRAGKRVIINGFGGTIYVNALLRATPEQHDLILDMHKSMIEQCVLAFNVPPPVYLWFKATPETALQRPQKKPSMSRVESPVAIESANKLFDFYGTLPGQKVCKIDADNPLETVIEETIDIIDQRELAHVA